MTTPTTKIVIVAGQEFSVPATTDNEAIRSHLASQGFTDVAGATIQTGKRKVGDEDVPTVEFVKKAGTKGLEGSDLAALIGRVPASAVPVIPQLGPTREQARLMRKVFDGELTIGEIVRCIEDIDDAIQSYYRADPIDYCGSRLCDRLHVHPAPAATDVRGW